MEARMTENEDLMKKLASLEARVEVLETKAGLRSPAPRQPSAHPFHLLDRVAKIPDDVALAMAKVVPGRVSDL
jgi:hypothetical protein